MLILRVAAGALAAAWMVALPAATFIVSRPLAEVTQAGYAFGLAVYAAGSLICHQQAVRSFHLFGAQMPVCARCTGIYAGAAIAAVVLMAWRRRASNVAQGFRLRQGYGGLAKAPDGATAVSPASVLLAAAVPTLLTLLFEWSTGQMPAHVTRALTGLPAGAAAMWVLLAAVDRHHRLQRTGGDTL